MSKKILVIIPAYNEEASIAATVSNLINLVSVDYLVVNDGSTDQTAQILHNYKYNYISLPINLGIGGAVQAGYRYALKNDYDYAIQMDADGQHDPKDLSRLIEEIQRNQYDMIIGSRFVKKTEYEGDTSRRIGIYFFYRLISVLTGIKVTDPTSGYRLVNRKIIKEFSEYYPVDYPEVEVLVYLTKKGYQVKEVSVEMKNRQGGVSSINIKRAVYYMFKVTLFSMIRRVF